MVLALKEILIKNYKANLWKGEIYIEKFAEKIIDSEDEICRKYGENAIEFHNYLKLSKSQKQGCTSKNAKQISKALKIL